MEAIRRRADLDRLVAAGGALAVQVVDPEVPASETFAADVASVCARLPRIATAVVDMRVAAEVAALFGIDRAPALVLFRAGVGLFAGPAPESASLLEALLRRALALDMDAVRTEMSRERADAEGVMTHRACPMSRRVDPEA